MKLIKTLMLTSLLLALTACGALTKSDRLVVPPQPPKLYAPDSALTKDCTAPVDIGGAPLTQNKTEKFWRQDRKSLIECGRGKSALRDFYADRDSKLAGKR